MKRSTTLALLLLFGQALSPARGADSFVLEPDDYPHRAVLNDVNPRVQLRIYDGVLRTDFPNQFGVFPDPGVIPVTALTNEDIFGGYFTSTGTKSFGHGGVDFTPESRQIAMRFLGPAGTVTIDVIGTSNLNTVVGVLEVFSPAGALLQTVTSAELARQQVATLSITRPGFDIGFARAYSSAAFSPFGAFDHLRFTSIPEPAGATLLLLSLALRWRRPGRPTSPLEPYL